MNMRHRPQADTPVLPRELGGPANDLDEKVVPIAAPPPSGYGPEGIWPVLKNRCKERFNNERPNFGYGPNIVIDPKPDQEAIERRRFRQQGHHLQDIFGVAWQYGDLEVLVRDHRTGYTQSLGYFTDLDRICQLAGLDQWVVKTRVHL